MSEIDILNIVTESMRLIYANMHNVPIVDIAYSLQYLPILGDEKKINRFLLRL
jgi:hypothetical protein